MHIAIEENSVSIDGRQFIETLKLESWKKLLGDNFRRWIGPGPDGKKPSKFPHLVFDEYGISLKTRWVDETEYVLGILVHLQDRDHESWPEKLFEGELIVAGTKIDAASHRNEIPVGFSCPENFGASERVEWFQSSWFDDYDKVFFPEDPPTDKNESISEESSSRNPKPHEEQTNSYNLSGMQEEQPRGCGYLGKGFLEAMGRWLFKLLGGSVSLVFKIFLGILAIALIIGFLFLLIGALANAANASSEQGAAEQPATPLRVDANRV